jgi:hypothetical protein
MEENYREEKHVLYLSYYGNPGVGKKKTNNGWSSIAEGQPKTLDRALRPHKLKPVPLTRAPTAGNPVSNPNPCGYSRMRLWNAVEACRHRWRALKMIEAQAYVTNDATKEPQGILLL